VEQFFPPPKIFSPTCVWMMKCSTTTVFPLYAIKKIEKKLWAHNLQKQKTKKGRKYVETSFTKLLFLLTWHFLASKHGCFLCEKLWGHFSNMRLDTLDFCYQNLMQPMRFVHFLSVLVLLNITWIEFFLWANCNFLEQTLDESLG